MSGLSFQVDYDSMVNNCLNRGFDAFKKHFSDEKPKQIIIGRVMSEMLISNLTSHEFINKVALAYGNEYNLEEICIDDLWIDSRNFWDVVIKSDEGQELYTKELDKGYRDGTFGHGVYDPEFKKFYPCEFGTHAVGIADAIFENYKDYYYVYCLSTNIMSKKDSFNMTFDKQLVSQKFKTSGTDEWKQAFKKINDLIVNHFVLVVARYNADWSMIKNYGIKDID